MTITITAAEARELLTRAVEEKGADYVYPSATCEYFKGTAPACIIGHIFAYKGVTYVPGDLNEASVSVLRSDEYLRVDDATYQALSEAQALQDGGRAWGEACASALEVLDREEAK